MKKINKAIIDRRTFTRLLPPAIILIACCAALIILFLPRATSNTANTNTDSLEMVTCEQEKSSDFDCWSQRFRAIVFTQSAQSAFTELKATYSNNSYIQSQCHQITHVIGRAVADTGVSVGEAYKSGDSFCWSGYYHGVVEEVAKSMGSDNFVASLNSICSDVQAESPYSFDHYNCVHGLGHGVMTVKDNELFNALDSCDTVSDTWNRTSCYGGVFMENVMSDPETNETHKTSYLRKDEPMYPCNAVKEQHKEQCYLMQTSYALRQVNNDFARVFELCAQIEQAHQHTCYQSTGRDASGMSVSDLAQTKSTCELGTTEFQRTNCAIGAVKDFISYHHDDVKAKQLCDSFSDSPVRETCHSTATSYYQTF